MDRLNLSKLKIRNAREVPGRNYSTPKELWGFRLAAQARLPRRAALAALCFTVGNGNGPKLALTIGVVFAAVGSAASFLRLRYSTHGSTML